MPVVETHYVGGMSSMDSIMKVDNIGIYTNCALMRAHQTCKQHCFNWNTAIRSVDRRSHAGQTLPHEPTYLTYITYSCCVTGWGYRSND